jgi:hypothetical protein
MSHAFSPLILFETLKPEALGIALPYAFTTCSIASIVAWPETNSATSAPITAMRKQLQHIGYPGLTSERSRPNHHKHVAFHIARKSTKAVIVRYPFFWNAAP